MKADYVHKDTLTATDYVELNKNNELLISYNQALLKENQELKQKYENAVADYETTKAEKEQLKKQLHEASLTIQEMTEQDIECPSNCEKLKILKEQLEEYKKLGFKYLQDKNNNLETQQKEFIEYMNKTIEELEYDDVDDEEMKGYLIQRIDTFKEILSKYQEIIGSDINVGSIGGNKDE